MKALSAEDREWWRHAIGYEIYLRSFLDTNGDGFGDLAGITAKLDYLKWVGIDVIWITPHYPTPDHDHGYDVADYLAVDPRVGDLAAIEHLIGEAHARGLRVFTDVVPNHTSNEHAWFKAAVADPTGPFRDYYLWKDPKADGSPPNNWVQHFGGPAWTLDPGGSGQYYCHLFLPEQPDLNWTNEAVRAEFDAILRFWCDRGVDGFRIDVAAGLMKHPSFADNPQIREVRPDDGPARIFNSFEHRYDLAQISTVDVYRRWNKVVEPYDAVLLGELGVWDPVQFAHFVEDGTALHMSFALEPGLIPWKVDRLLDCVLGMAEHAGSGVAWEITNHDQHRAPSRLGDGDPIRGRRRALALTTLLVGLDGMFFVYQGEELGLDDGRVTQGGLQDPISVRNPGDHHDGRDGARTPIPWTPGPRNGFTSATTPWIDAFDRTDAETVAVQEADPASYLHHYRALLRLRRSWPGLSHDPLLALNRERVDATHQVVTVLRANTLVVANLGLDEAEVAVPGGAWTVAFQSWPLHAPTGQPAVRKVPAETTVVLVRTSD